MRTSFTCSVPTVGFEPSNTNLRLVSFGAESLVFNTFEPLNKVWEAFTNDALTDTPAVVTSAIGIS